MVVGSGKSGKNMIVGSKRVRSLGSNVDVTCEKAICPHRGEGCVPEVRTNVHDLCATLSSYKSLRFALPFCPPKIMILLCRSSEHAEWNLHLGLGVRNVQRFRGGLVFKAYRLLYHSTLGLRVTKKKKQFRVWG